MAGYSGFFCLGCFYTCFFGIYLFLGVFSGVGGGVLRSYLFTDRDRERLRAWLESGVEDDGTRMIFVAMRRSLRRIVVDVDLMVLVLRRLRAEGRLMGRARLPGDLGRTVRGLESGLRACRKLS